jgi:hypothetical protein
MQTPDGNTTILGLTLRRLRGDAWTLFADPISWRRRALAHTEAFRRAQAEMGPAAEAPAPSGPALDRAGEAALILADKYETDPLHPEAGPFAARFSSQAAGMARLLLTGELAEQQGTILELSNLIRPAKTPDYPVPVRAPNMSRKLIIGRSTGSAIGDALSILQRASEESFPRPEFLTPDPVYSALEACIRTLAAAEAANPFDFADGARVLDAAVQAAYVAYAALSGGAKAPVQVHYSMDESPTRIFASFVRDVWPEIGALMAAKYSGGRMSAASGRTDPGVFTPTSANGMPQLLGDSIWAEVARRSDALLAEDADAQLAEEDGGFLPCDILEFISDADFPSIRAWRDVEEMSVTYTRGYEDGMLVRLWLDDSIAPGESRHVDVLVTEPSTFISFASIGEGDPSRSNLVSSLRIEHVPVSISENPDFSFFDPDSSEVRWLVSDAPPSMDPPGTLELDVRCGRRAPRRRWTVGEFNARTFIASRNFLTNYDGGRGV